MVAKRHFDSLIGSNGIKFPFTESFEKKMRAEYLIGKCGEAYLFGKCYGA